MGYDIHWDTTGQYVRLKLVGHITINDLRDSGQIITSYADTIDRPFSVIVDTSQVRSMFIKIEHVRRALKYVNHPQTQWVLVVGTSQIIRLYFTALMNVSEAGLKFFAHNDELGHFLTPKPSTTSTNPLTK